MKMTIVLYAIKMLMSWLTPEKLLELISLLNGKISSFVLGTENTIDDAIWAVLKEGPNHPDAKKLIDTILDFGEDFVLGTKSELDDAIAMPFFKSIRAAWSIPDND
ncbi:MAG: hypothetical protein HOK67_04060 [Deltaproteobacteria bacterium]|nr:hypothetical protein [Deltaproteobacteria bacterium]